MAQREIILPKLNSGAESNELVKNLESKVAEINAALNSLSEYKKEDLLTRMGYGNREKVAEIVNLGEGLRNLDEAQREPVLDKIIKLLERFNTSSTDDMFAIVDVSSYRRNYVVERFVSGMHREQGKGEILKGTSLALVGVEAEPESSSVPLRERDSNSRRLSLSGGGNLDSDKEEILDKVYSTAEEERLWVRAAVEKQSHLRDNPEFISKEFEELIDEISKNLNRIDSVRNPKELDLVASMDPVTKMQLRKMFLFGESLSSFRNFDKREHDSVLKKIMKLLDRFEEKDTNSLISWLGLRDKVSLNSYIALEHSRINRMNRMNR